MTILRNITTSKAATKNTVELAPSVVQARLYEEVKAIKLPQGDFAAFLDVLDAPPQSVPALQRAFARHANQAR